jgi:hypothetical protein
MIGEFCRWRWTIGEFAQESRLALLVAIFSELWPIRFRIALLVKGLQLSTDWWRFSRRSTLGMCTCGFMSQSIQNLTKKIMFLRQRRDNTSPIWRNPPQLLVGSVNRTMYCTTAPMERGGSCIVLPKAKISSITISHPNQYRVPVLRGVRDFSTNSCPTNRRPVARCCFLVFLASRPASMV